MSIFKNILIFLFLLSSKIAFTIPVFPDYPLETSDPFPSIDDFNDI